MILLSVSCSQESSNNFSSKFPESNSANYFRNAQSVTVDVYYETGAAPYDGDRGLPFSNPFWDITEDNLNEIFKFRSRPPVVTVPKNLNAMTEIPDSGRASWGINDVIDLYDKYHSNTSTKSNSVFYIYFVNGNSSSGNSVIGFSINTTPVIVIFKDVIRLIGNPRYAEQTTIVHELGHALGFVNNGVPMVANHQDVEHGAHTTNTEGVMYWLNENSDGIGDIIQSNLNNSEILLWGNEVLADAQGYSE